MKIHEPDAIRLRALGVDVDGEPQVVVSMEKYLQAVRLNDTVINDNLSLRSNIEWVNGQNRLICRSRERYRSAFYWLLLYAAIATIGTIATFVNLLRSAL